MLYLGHRDLFEATCDAKTTLVCRLQRSQSVPFCAPIVQMDPNLTIFPFRFRILSVQPTFVCLRDPFDTSRVIGLVGRDSVLTYFVDLGEADPVVATSTHRRQWQLVTTIKCTSYAWVHRCTVPEHHLLIRKCSGTFGETFSFDC